MSQAGPEEFYFENGKLPKFLMMVEEGITIEIFEVKHHHQNHHHHCRRHDHHQNHDHHYAIL